LIIENNFKEVVIAKSKYYSLICIEGLMKTSNGMSAEPVPEPGLKLTTCQMQVQSTVAAVCSATACFVLKVFDVNATAFDIADSTGSRSTPWHTRFSSRHHQISRLHSGL
jgi:hypothetical protein